MNRNSINFDDKKIKKSDFYNKNKKIFNIKDIDVIKILVPKMGIMIMILLNHYI